MTRDKFLQELRIALQGRVPQKEANEQLRYYENYIIEESRKGRTEAEVLAELGDPRLIAKTIAGLYGDGAYYESKSADSQPKTERRFRFRTWHGCLATAILLAVLVILLVSIGILLLPFIGAAVMIGAMAYLIFTIFFRNKK